MWMFCGWKSKNLFSPKLFFSNKVVQSPSKATHLSNSKVLKSTKKKEERSIYQRGWKRYRKWLEYFKYITIKTVVLLWIGFFQQNRPKTSFEYLFVRNSFCSSSPTNSHCPPYNFVRLFSAFRLIYFIIHRCNLFLERNDFIWKNYYLLL